VIAFASVATHKPPIPVGTVKAEALGVNGPTTWANIFYFAVGTFDPAHLNDVTTLVGSAVHDFYTSGFTLAYFVPSWTLQRTKVTFRDASDSLYRSVYVVSATGTATAEVAVANASWLVNYTTNDPRKGGKPRTYVSGLNDDDLADSANLVSANVTTISGTLSTWLAGLNARTSGTASNLSLLEMSFRDGNTWRDTAATWPVRAIALNPVASTQRRRLDRART
jgi:hypothetical protein